MKSENTKINNKTFTGIVFCASPTSEVCEELFLFASFSPTPDVMWLRKDGVLSESRTTRDMFDRRLRFSNISESDAGEYQCSANNTQGKVTHTYTVIVEGTSCPRQSGIRISQCIFP